MLWTPTPVGPGTRETTDANRKPATATGPACLEDSTKAGGIAYMYGLATGSGCHPILNEGVGKERIQNEASKAGGEQGPMERNKSSNGGQNRDARSHQSPSHGDIEGNERVDEMAKEGFKKHGKKMRDEKEQEKAEAAREKKRQMKEEGGKDKLEWKSSPNSLRPQKPEVMPQGKIYKPNSTH